MESKNESRSFEVINREGAKPIKAWTVGVPFAENAKDQLARTASLPFVYKWVAAMPDVPPVHWGYNAAYIAEHEAMAAAPDGSNKPRLPVLLAVVPIARPMATA